MLKKTGLTGVSVSVIGDRISMSLKAEGSSDSNYVEFFSVVPNKDGTFSVKCKQVPKEDFLDFLISKGYKEEAFLLKSSLMDEKTCELTDSKTRSQSSESRTAIGFVYTQCPARIICGSTSHKLEWISANYNVQYKSSRLRATEGPTAWEVVYERLYPYNHIFQRIISRGEALYCNYKFANPSKPTYAHHATNMIGKLNGRYEWRATASHWGEWSGLLSWDTFSYSY